jgi:mannosyltransferase OCH1-like enzyme
MKTLPHVFHRALSSFKEQNPDYEFRFIGSLQELRNDMLRLEGESGLKAFDTFTPMAFKVDLWRIVMMYHYGGVYCDSKLTLEEPLDILLSQNYKFSTSASQSILVKDQWHAVQNSFMAMPPGTVFARRSIDGIYKKIDKRSYEGGNLGIAG